jgi:hypothetical protein
MGEVVDFTARRLKEKPKQVTIEELHVRALEYLLADWEKMARNNRLNDYFRQSVPQVDSSTKTNYMSDLNEIAALELNIELFPVIYFPGTNDMKQLGWQVHFFLAKTRLATPELASEAYARCFAILLYLKVKRDAIGAGISV